MRGYKFIYEENIKIGEFMLIYYNNGEFNFYGKL